ncbi:hypothetical protein [Gryllotalpicola koreensis]|uniref:Uncharacterized protein n=1 Tax=Gryllotalpicola koreensis TaxID=993086 RepID=A0ABP8ABY9_9MICO
MSDKNTAPTAKLDELFASETDAGAEGAAVGDGSAAPAPTASLPAAEPAWLSPRPERPVRTTPRVRWAGIIWGLVFAAAGWFTVWTLLAEDRRAAFSDWILSLSGGGWAIVGALGLGALLLIIGLTQGLKAATRQRS